MTRTGSGAQQMCTCGHDRAAHTHLRRGTDCASCTDHACTSFRTDRSWLRRLLPLQRPDHIDVTDPAPEADLREERRTPSREHR